MTRFFKNKQSKKPVEQVPRTMEEINKEYADVSAKASQSQYQVYVYTEHLAQLNRQMRSLNEEATARQALDKAANTSLQPIVSPNVSA
jgi:hypothetical protein